MSRHVLWKPASGPIQAEMIAHGSAVFGGPRSPSPVQRYLSGQDWTEDATPFRACATLGLIAVTLGELSSYSRTGPFRVV